MQLTNNRIYFTWEHARRRQDIPLFEDVENTRELPPPIAPISDREFQGLWVGQFSRYSAKSLLLSADSDFVLICFVVTRSREKAFRGLH